MSRRDSQSFLQLELTKDAIVIPAVAVAMPLNVAIDAAIDDLLASPRELPWLWYHALIGEGSTPLIRQHVLGVVRDSKLDLELLDRRFEQGWANTTIQLCVELRDSSETRPSWVCPAWQVLVDDQKKLEGSGRAPFLHQLLSSATLAPNPPSVRLIDALKAADHRHLLFRSRSTGRDALLLDISANYITCHGFREDGHRTTLWSEQRTADCENWAVQAAQGEPDLELASGL